jgi:hypothetical protein
MSISAAAITVDQLEAKEEIQEAIATELSSFKKKYKVAKEGKDKAESDNISLRDSVVTLEGDKSHLQIEINRLQQANKELLDAQERQLLGTDNDDLMSAQSEDKHELSNASYLRDDALDNLPDGIKDDLDAHIENCELPICYGAEHLEGCHIKIDLFQFCPSSKTNMTPVVMLKKLRRLLRTEMQLFRNVCLCLVSAWIASSIDDLTLSVSNELAKQEDALHNKVSEMKGRIDEREGQGLPVTYSRD